MSQSRPIYAGQPSRDTQTKLTPVKPHTVSWRRHERRKTTSTSWTPTSASSWRRIRPRCDHWEGDATTWAFHTNGDHPELIKDGVSIECHSEHCVPLVEVARKEEVPACEDTPLASGDAGGVCVAEWLQPFTEGHMDEPKS